MSPRVIKSRIGLIGILFLTFFPLIPWVFMMPLGMRFGDAFTALGSVGQIAALLGTVLFALTLILSARFHFLEDYFGGVDRIYHVHHIAGTIAFLLLLTHPMVLAIRLVPISVVDAAKFLIPGGDWTLNFGIFSLLLMMSLLTVTFFAKWRYQYLRFAHQILGGAFFLGALHAFLIPSDISQDIVLRTYVLGLSGIAIGAYLYRTIFGRAAVKKFTYIVDAVNDLGQGVTEVVMRPESDVMHYTPGQFLFVSFRDGGVGREIHPFSISSAPTEDVIRITVKALGDWTTDLKDLNVGAVAKLEGPFGSFSYLKAHNKKQVWIAGGIGITPFLNMARNLKVNKRDDLEIDFYYATKTSDEMIFMDELKAVVTEYPNLRLIPFASEEYGFLSADIVTQVSGELHATDIFVCGPPPMMHSLTAQFALAKIPKRLVHTEEFKLL
ncbi:FAD-binding oxidoreductase [Candidatus Pacebacteria bacterium]|nr:FAD-binding oxidoreductase [Candidatus Paceibacterota bacterium]